MKFLPVFFFAVLSLLPLSAKADPARVRWIDLNEKNQLQISQDLALGKDLVKAGTEVVITEVTPLDMIQVVEYRMAIPGCPDPTAEGEMEIILPEGSVEGAEAGVQLRKGCELAVYVESRDLHDLSFFY